MATIDPDVPRLRKTPGESGPFLFDLAGRLLPNLTLSGPAVAVEKQGRAVGSADIVPQAIGVQCQAVQCRLPGGTDEEDYLLTVTADNSGAGNTEAYFLLQVRDAKVGA